MNAKTSIIIVIILATVFNHYDLKKNTRPIMNMHYKNIAIDMTTIPFDAIGKKEIILKQSMKYRTKIK